MIADNINVLDDEQKLTIKNGIVSANHIHFRQVENNFGKVLLNGMKNNPTFISQIDPETGKEDTFSDIADRAMKCALWLVSQGVKSGDVVAICTHNHIDSPIPILACLFIGAIFNPWWDHGLNKDTAKHFMTLTTPKILFTDEQYIKLINDVANDLNMNFKIVIFGNNNCGLIRFNDIMEKYKSKDIENFECTKLSSINEPAYIEYTSGSTGLPKGALHSHKSLFGNIMNTGSFGGNNQVVLCYSNLCWITGVLCTFSTIANFQRRIIGKVFSPLNLCQLVEKYKVTWILTGTSLANRLLKSGELERYDVSSLKSIWIGGATLKEDAQDALRAAFRGTDILQAYGTTETGGISVHQTRTTKPNSIGKVAKCFDLKVIDPETEKILGPNEKGELCVKSPYMMTGYYKNPEKTKEIIKSEGWLHTGDLGYYDDDGEVYIIDRLKELIKWRGHHVSPSVVEQLIQTYPGVSETAVVGIPDWEDDERPIAFLTKSSDAKISENDIAKLVEDNLPEQMWLRGGVQILNQIPHTASGKIARTELKEMARKFIRNS